MEYTKKHNSAVSIATDHIPFLLLLLLQFLSMPLQSAAVSADALPAGCQQTCGDFKIPYPFGIGKNCSRDGFVLNCSSIDDGTYKPFFGNVEILSISLSLGHVRMNNHISSTCYNSTNRTADYDDWELNLTGTPYRFSDVHNKFTTIGCETLAYILSSDGRSDFESGCVSWCPSADSLIDGSCGGIGCCQTAIPKNISYYRVYFDENFNSSDVWTFSPCSYAVLMEAAAFDFRRAYVTTDEFGRKYQEAPLVVDWAVGSEKCEHAWRNMTSYACVSKHSECVNSQNGPGYLCNCSKGYQGNPYLHGGCEDVDECVNTDEPPCSGLCFNKLGNYVCICPPGTHGNPYSNGTCYQNQKVSLAVKLAAGISFSILVLLIFATCLHMVHQRRMLIKVKSNNFQQHGGWQLSEEIKKMKGHLAFKIYTEEELERASNKFDKNNILGHGGHGIVYKGMLENSAVAIKKTKMVDESRKKEFGKEMLILSQINHKNIVKLLGCCLEVEVPMLVYEFISNGTLFQLIHSKRYGPRFSLETRLRIAFESAEALAYLHSSASPPIIHGDVKSSNILLDNHYMAKVSDFGASILAPMDEAQFVTLVQGTCGYLDPEYLQTCQLTDKSDVYSFGVVLLELLTGKKALYFEGAGLERSLSSSFLSAMKEGRLGELIDDQIKNEEEMRLIEEVAELARACLNVKGEDRPSMKEVVEDLDRIRKLKQHPWVQNNPEEMESLLSESSKYQETEITSNYFSIETNIMQNIESGR